MKTHLELIRWATSDITPHILLFFYVKSDGKAIMYYKVISF